MPSAEMVFCMQMPISRTNFRIQTNNADPDSVPIHVELRVIHSEIVKVTHTFYDQNVNSHTFFLSQNV